MSYLRSRTLSQRQNELQTLIDERLENEDERVRKRVYTWLSNNQYFVDNELFDFYCCVAQNLAAVEVLGGSGEKMLLAQRELENSAQACTRQFTNTATQVTEKLNQQLSSVRDKQDHLEDKLTEVLEALAREQENIKSISTGLVDSISAILVQQKKLSASTSSRSRLMYNPVITVIALLGWLAATLILLIVP